MRLTRSLAALAATLFVCISTFAQATPPAPTSPSPPPAIDLSTTPTLFLVGYAHLDTQWRWSYPQVIREYITSTMRDNFPLFEKYPHYVFNFSGSRRYQMMKEYLPEDFERVRTLVHQGRWFPCGSSVDENDANVPSAESLVRHVLYGNRWFRKEFGVASNEYMLPDCFGFPAALPSVLAHCGIKGFSTQKLTWGSAVGIPFNIGVWEGPDGNGVIAAFNPGEYVGKVTEDLSQSKKWLDRINATGKATGTFTDYHYFGTGDIGGAPPEETVAMVEKSATSHGPLRVVSGPADLMFNAITPEQREKLPRYTGELLLTEHSAGSITSQAFMKRCNRKNELLADAAERAATFAHFYAALPYPAKQLEDAWCLVLGSQMHDILPGTCIPQAYEYAWNDEIIALNQFAGVLTDSIGALASTLDTRANGTPVVVYNALSIGREDIVEASIPFEGEAPMAVTVIAPDGSETPVQILSATDGSAKIIFLGRAPSVGLGVFDVRLSTPTKIAANPLTISGQTIENAALRITVNADGDVSSIFDKQTNRETLAAPARLAFHSESPRDWPAWNMDWDDRQQPARAFVAGPATIEIVERGPVRAALRITRESEGSRFIQTIRLSAIGDTAEFDTQIDWATPGSSLKATFPLADANPLATYDIQTGTITRNNNYAKRYENPSHQWFDLTDNSGAHGVSILNDCKYASDKPDDNTLRLTLLYTPVAHSGYQDQATQDFGRHEMLYALAPHAGDWRAGNTPWKAARLNQPLRAFIVPKHPGSSKSVSYLTVGDPNVMISAIKKAEDSDEIIVRLRELSGTDASKLTITSSTPITTARQVDGQERPIRDAVVSDNGVTTEIKGYALKAMALTPVRASIPEVTMRHFGFPLDADVVSANGLRADGGVDTNFRTYPAEQWPAVLVSGGINFRFGHTNSGSPSAIRCNGQYITIPDSVDRVHVLIASDDLPRDANFFIGNTKVNRRISPWRGFVGQWDNRSWDGSVPELAYSWTNRMVGLSPGFIQPQRIAWYCSHHHSPHGDAVYQYCYLFHETFNIPPGTNSITLPGNPHFFIVAATATKDAHRAATPASPLYDTLANRDPEAPRIMAPSGQLADATTFEILPRLYGGPGSIRYTVDGTDPTPSSPAYTAPITLSQTTTIKAGVTTRERTMGPIASSTITINDTTPPSVVRTLARDRSTEVLIAFSEPINAADNAAIATCTFDPPVSITSTTLQPDARGIKLTIAQPLETGRAYQLSIANLRDNSPAHNTIAPTTIAVTAKGPIFHTASFTPDQIGKPIEVPGLPVKAGDSWTLNMFIRADKHPGDLTPIAGFGHCADDVDGGARYIARFDSGLRFWARNRDVAARGTQLDLGQWNMLTATYDGKVIRFYKNANLLAENAAVLADETSVINIFPIDPWDKQRRFEGEIRDFAIWDTDLGTASLQAILVAPSQP